MYSANYNHSENVNILTGIGIGYVTFILAILVLTLVAEWRIFEKAGKPGWAILIPFYNLYTMFEIAGMNGWMFLLLLIPLVNIIVTIKLFINFAHAFGKSTLFGIGLLFFNTIFTLILAFDGSEYVGN